MSHNHTDVIIIPGAIRKHGDGFAVGDLEHGTMQCKDCGQELAIEDRGLYTQDHTFIGVPTELVDD